MAKQTKVITRRKKFIPVDIVSINARLELIGNSVDEIHGKTIKLDLTRQLKGKSVEGTFRVRVDKGKAIAMPIKVKLMPYFIRRMIRKRISYVEDSFEAPSQNSILIVKPFLITRKRVSRIVRKTLRNKARNWLEDYISDRKDEEIFNDLLNNKLQKPLSLVLKKTYPLSLCEIRILEIKRPLEKNEVPKIDKKKKIEIDVKSLKKTPKIEEGLDQLKEIEEEKIKKAREEIKETQEKAVEKESKESEKVVKDLKSEIKEAKKKLIDRIKKAKEEKNE